MYAHFHISWYSQSSSLDTRLQRSSGALHTSVSQVAWPIKNLGDTVMFSGGKVQQVYLFLSLLLLIHKAVIVNYWGILSYPDILMGIVLVSKSWGFMVSQKHKMFEVGMDIWRPSCTTTLLKPGHLEPGPCTGTFWVAPRREIPQLPWQLVPVLTAKKTFPDAQREPPVLQLVLVASVSYCHPSNTVEEC